MVSVSRRSTRGEDSVRPDEREAAAGLSVDDGDEFGVAPDTGRLERAADAGAGHDQHVASAAEQVMEAGRSVLTTDLEVGEPVSGLRPAAVTVGLDEQARWVGDRKLGHGAGYATLDHRHAAHDGNEDVPHRPPGPVPHGQEPDDLVGELEYAGRDGDAFLAVGIQERVRGAAVYDQGQLPGEVVRVHHPGVHALAAGGRVDVRGVAGEQHAPAPVAPG